MAEAMIIGFPLFIIGCLLGFWVGRADRNLERRVRAFEDQAWLLGAEREIREVREELEGE